MTLSPLCCCRAKALGHDVVAYGGIVTTLRAKTYLDMIPEPALLPLLSTLGLILLPTLLRRR